MELMRAVLVSMGTGAHACDEGCSVIIIYLCDDYSTPVNIITPVAKANRLPLTSHLGRQMNTTNK